MRTKAALLIATFLLLFCSCSNIVWDIRPRSVSDIQTVTIVISDPLFEWMIAWNNYESSEYYEIISFEEWYTTYYNK